VSKPKRILAIASGGGHFVQLLRLRAAWEGHDVTYATVHAASAVDVAPAPLMTFRDVSRADIWPQVIISTGALPPFLAMVLVKPFGVRTLWVDSIANSEVLSDSGRYASKVASTVVTQWPQLASDDVEHWGSVL